MFCLVSLILTNNNVFRMKLFKKFGLFLFWIILLLDCVFTIINSQEYRIYTKPFLIPVLALYFYLNTKRSRHFTTKTWVYLSLLFSWTSELLFLKNDSMAKFQGDVFLQAGILLLILTFLIYAMLFVKMNKLDIKDCQEAFISTALLSIVGLIFFKFFRYEKVENSFKYLVAVCLVITSLVMGLAANIYKNKVRKNMAYQYFIPGFFIITLSVYIVFTHRFLLQDAEFLPPVIVLTYGFGQMLILRGFAKYLKA